MAVVREALTPGAKLTEVARRHGLLPAQVYKWRRLAELGVIDIPGASELPSFVAVEVVADGGVAAGTTPVAMVPALAEPAAAPSLRPARRRRRASGLIEIDLGAGRCVRVDRAVDAEALARVLEVLGRR
jgi:transposase